MRVTVLGKSPSYTDAGGACSGYLVEEDGVVVLLDCGNGVFGKLRALRRLRRGRRGRHQRTCTPTTSSTSSRSPTRCATRRASSPSRSTAGPAPTRRRGRCCTRRRAPRDVFRRVVGAWGPEDLIEDAFDLREYEPGDVLEIGTLRVRFHQVPHFMPNTNAVEFCVVRRRRAHHLRRRPLADRRARRRSPRDTDLLLIEATLPRPERDGVRGHITPAEAGEHARRASARRAVLVHISDELDHLWARECASEAFGSAVDDRGRGRRLRRLTATRRRDARASASASARLVPHDRARAAASRQRGEYDLRPIVGRLPLDGVPGARVLDVGTHDGFYAFELERRGAREVVAIDLAEPADWDWPGRPPAESRPPRAASPRPARRRSRSRARRAARRSTCAMSRSTTLIRHEHGTFDLAVIGTLLLHLRDPVGALRADPPRGAHRCWSTTSSHCRCRCAGRARRTSACIGREGLPFWWIPNKGGARCAYVEAAGWTDRGGGPALPRPVRCGAHAPRARCGSGCAPARRCSTSSS